MEKNQVPLSELWPLMQEQIDSGKKVVFAPKGTSMLPLIRQGKDKVVLVKAPEKLKKYDLPLYRRENGQFVLHRVVKVREDGYVMCGDNQFEREYGITDAQILALSCGMYKDGEYISFDDKKYRRYCKKQVRKSWFYSIYVSFMRFGSKIKQKILKKALNKK